MPTGGGMSTSNLASVNCPESFLTRNEYLVVSCEERNSFLDETTKANAIFFERYATFIGSCTLERA